MPVNIKDPLIIHTVENGEMIALAQGNPVAIGDLVLVSKLPDGTFVTHGNDTIDVQDTVLVTKMINGEYVAVKGGNCFLISKGYSRPLDYGYPIPPGTELAVDFLGTFKYKWDGEGKVYVSSSCCANVEIDQITLDDLLLVVNSKGKTKSCSYNGIGGYQGVLKPGPDLEITDLLTKGINELQFFICDVYGAGIGCGSLYISQTYLSTGGNHFLVTDGYSKKISTVGIETDTIAAVDYIWDGIGKIYVAGSYCADPTIDKILVDDQLIVSNSNGQSVNVINPSVANPSGVPDLDITSLLIKGANHLTFQVHDIYGVGIGCQALYLVQY